MTESQFQSKLLRALRQSLPQAVIVKWSDRFTCGMPDVMVSLNGVVTWFELKVGGNPATLIQLETLRKLKRGYLVRWHKGSASIMYVQYLAEEPPYEFSVLVERIIQICGSD